MNQTQPFFRVVQLRVSNVKRIKAIEILPTTNVVTIGGANDQGKSSLLDSIYYLFAGNGVVCDDPIRHGASKAEIQAELKEYPGTDDKALLIGDLIVKKVFSASNSPTLRITTKAGVAVSSPQTILDQLCVKVTFDPLAFTRYEPAKQAETLRKLVGLDFTDLNVKRQQVYDERTIINRDLTQKQTRLASLTAHADAPAEEVSVGVLMAELNVIRSKNQENERVRNAAGAHNNAVLDANREVAAIKREIVATEAKIHELRQELDAKHVLLANKNNVLSQAEAVALGHQAVIMALKDMPETEVQARIANADTANAKYRDAKARKELAVEVQELEADAQTRTVQIDGIDAQKQKMLSEAKFPLQGLSFDDSGVLLNGVAFSQAGTADKIRASMAIGIALNPRLRIVLIRDTSLLDAASKAEIEKSARENDVQVWSEEIWSEQTDSDGKPIEGQYRPCVVIEDGAIKEA